MRASISTALLTVLVALVPLSSATDTHTFQSAPDQSTVQPAPRGVIRGRVLSADTGLPLSAALVQLTGVDLSRTGGIFSTTTRSDASGRYEFRGLNGGRYALSASMASYVPISYGQRRLTDLQADIVLDAGQVLENIDIALPAGSVVAVRVTDDVGEPVAGALVHLATLETAGGQQRFVTRSNGGGPLISPLAAVMATNDLGEVRLAGVAPGEYFAIVEPPTNAPIGATDSRRAFATTFYPGVTSAADARPVMVGLSQQLGIVMALGVARVATVSGTIRGSNGERGQASVALRQAGVQTVLTRIISADGQGLVFNNDRFTVRNVFPGSYFLIARVSATDGSGEEYAQVALDVAGADIPNVNLTTTKGATLRGRVVFDSGSPPTQLRPEALRISATDAAQGIVASGRLAMNDDWTFVLAGVVGRGTLRITTASRDWVTKAVVVDGQDVADTFVDFNQRDLFDNVQLVVTQTPAELSGSIVDRQDRPTTNGVALVFPEESRLWTPNSRLIQVRRPDNRAAYRIPELLAGRYLAIAVDNLAAGAERDPAVLERLAGHATRVTLGDGEKRSLNLRLTETAP